MFRSCPFQSFLLESPFGTPSFKILLLMNCLFPLLRTFARLASIFACCAFLSPREYGYMSVFLTHYHPCLHGEIDCFSSRRTWKGINSAVQTSVSISPYKINTSTMSSSNEMNRIFSDRDTTSTLETSKNRKRVL